MDTEYVIMNWTELGFLTPLETALISSQPTLYDFVRHRVDTSQEITAEEVAFMAEDLWGQLPGHVKLATINSVADTWFSITSMIKSRINGIVDSCVRSSDTVTGLAWQTGNNNWLDTMLEDGNQNLPALFTKQAIAAGQIEPIINTGFTSIKNRYIRQLAMVEEATTNIDGDLVISYQTLIEGFSERWRRQAGEVVTYDMLSDSCDDIMSCDDFTINTLRTRPKKTLAEKAKEEKERAARERLTIKNAKRAIKRGYNFFMDHAREKEIKLFVSGNSVEVSHPSSDLKFVLARSKRLNMVNSSVQHGGQWGNIDVKIFTKTDVFLSGICVYIKDTPVLDQLMGLIMMVEAGLEEELIEKGNIKGINKNIDFNTLLSESSKLRSKLKEYTDGSYVNNIIIDEYTNDVATTSSTVTYASLRDEDINFINSVNESFNVVFSMQPEDAISRVLTHSSATNSIAGSQIASQLFYHNRNNRITYQVRD